MKQYDLIIRAISFLSDNFRRQPALEEVAEHLGVSMFHLQRTFREWVGISPKRFVQFLTIDYARTLLDQSRSILDTTFETGMSSPGRMHDLFVSIDAVTPGEFKSKGAGLIIKYGIHDSPFGKVCIGITGKGICGLSFHDSNPSAEGLSYLQKRWTKAQFIEDSTQTKYYCQRIFSANRNNQTEPIKLLLKGTNFQLKVWEALLKIPSGYVFSYQDIAEWIGEPTASRAVGNAVGANPISYLIPCHRVIQKGGIIGNYHWGPARKKSILIWESAQRESRDHHVEN